MLRLVLIAVLCAACSMARGDVSLSGSESRALGVPSVPSAGEAAPVVDPVDMTRMIVSLGGVVVAILLLGWGAKSVAKRSGGLGMAMGAGGRAPAGVLEVLGRYPVSRGQTLVLLKLDRRVLLLSQRPGEGMRTLCEVTEPEDVASLLLKTQGEDDRRRAEQFGGELRRHAAAVAPAIPSARRVRSSAEGDRVELLGGASEMTGEDAARQLRERLARLRAGSIPAGGAG